LRTLDDSGELVVIDFEYAGYNTRGFDIGNHFCEWTADYHSERPSLMHPDRYPTKTEQMNFLEAYMEAEIAMCGYHLTAINMEKHTKKRRSIRAALTKGLTHAALKAVNAAQSLRKSPVTEFQKEELEVAKVVAREGLAKNDAAATASAAGASAATTGTTATTDNNKGRGNRAVEHPHEAPRSKRDGGDGGGGVTKSEILDSMYKEVNKFALTSHIMWGLWGLIQATQSEIEFDYVEYALQRLNEFRRRRDEFMSL